MNITNKIKDGTYELLVIKNAAVLRAEQRQLDRDIGEYVANEVDEDYVPMGGLVS